MINFHFFNKPQLNKFLHLSIILIFCFCLILLCHYLFFPDVFGFWNRWAGDFLFKIRYRIKDYKNVSPHIVHIELKDTDMALYPRSIDEYPFSSENYYSTLSDIMYSLRQLEASNVIFNLLMTERPRQNQDNERNIPVITFDNMYFPVIMGLKPKNPLILDSYQVEILYKNLWLPQVLKKGKTYPTEFNIAPLLKYMETAKGLGHANLTPDRDGKNRYYPLINRHIHLTNWYFPSIAFKAVCDFLKVDLKKAQITFGSHILLPQAVFPDSHSQDIKIPINEKGQIYLDWTCPWKESFWQFSVDEILNAKYNKKLAVKLKEIISGSIVIFSDASIPSREYSSIMFQDVISSSSIYSNLANMILTRNFLFPMKLWIKIGLNLVFIFLFLLLSLKWQSYRLLLGSIILYLCFMVINSVFFIYLNSVNDLFTFSLAFFLSAFFIIIYLFFTEEQNRYILLAEKKVEQDKKTFLHYISHELKTPLTVILGNIELINERENEIISSSILKNIKSIRNGTNDLLNMNNLLLELIDFHAGKLNLRTIKLDFQVFMSDIIHCFLSVCHKKKIYFQTQNIEQPIYVYLDPNKIYRIMSYILFNSLHNTPENGQIELKVQLTSKMKTNNNEEKYINLCIKDTGPRIPLNELSLLYDKFDLIHCTNTRLYGGAGIRLYLAKQYIEMHRGFFEITPGSRNGNIFNLNFVLGKSHLLPSEIVEDRRENDLKRSYDKLKSKYFSDMISEVSTLPEPEKDGHKKAGLILVADKNARLRRYIKGILRTRYFVMEAVNGMDALKFARKKRPDLIICSARMPEMNGFTFLNNIKKDKHISKIPVILLTVLDGLDLKNNSSVKPDDFLVKPFKPWDLISKVNSILTCKQGKKQLNKNAETVKLNNPEVFSAVVTCSQTMYKMFRTVEKIAGSPDEILITGETGVGKESIAGIIHVLSGVSGILVKINSAGLDDALFSDTLFGHQKGAFTDAGSDRAGLIEKAKNGTLFLDEIGDLSAESQVKLLRLLEEKTYYRLGSDQENLANVRIIAATNVNLQDKMEKGEFRRDLFYRLNTHHIQIPPLRDRFEDLPLLIDHFFKLRAEELDKKIPFIPEELPVLLSTYHFPGNIRELKNMIKAALSRHEEKVLSLTYFKDYIKKNTSKGDLNINWGVSDQSWQNSITFNGYITLAELEQAYIDNILKKTKGNYSIAAQYLGINPSTISRKMKKKSKAN